MNPITVYDNPYTDNFDKCFYYIFNSKLLGFIHWINVCNIFTACYIHYLNIFTV